MAESRTLSSFLRSKYWPQWCRLVTAVRNVGQFALRQRRPRACLVLYDTKRTCRSVTHHLMGSWILTHCDGAVATSFPAFPQVTPLLWILAGIVVTLGVVGLAAVITFRVRGGMCGDCFDRDDDDQRTSTGSPESLTEAGNKMSTASTGNLLTVSLQGIKGPVVVTAEEMDERNPDVIPHTTGETLGDGESYHKRSKPSAWIGK